MARRRKRLERAHRCKIVQRRARWTTADGGWTRLGASRYYTRGQESTTARVLHRGERGTELAAVARALAQAEPIAQSAHRDDVGRVPLKIPRCIARAGGARDGVRDTSCGDEGGHPCQSYSGRRPHACVDLRFSPLRSGQLSCLSTKKASTVRGAPVPVA